MGIRNRIQDRKPTAKQLLGCLMPSGYIYYVQCFVHSLFWPCLSPRQLLFPARQKQLFLTLDNTEFPELELCPCKAHSKMNPVFGWLQLNCFMNSPGLSSSTHATRDLCDPVESLTSLSGSGRRKIKKTSTSCKRLFHPCSERSVFTGHGEFQFPPHSTLVLSQLQSIRGEWHQF